MPTSISGTITLSGNTVSGAVVYAIDTNNNTVVDTATSDSSGNYTLSVPYNEPIHVATEYDDGSTLYNAESKPQIIIEAVESTLDTSTTQTFTPTVTAATGATVLDDFESYTSGNTLTSEAPEWGNANWGNDITVKSSGNLNGSQEAGHKASSNSIWSAKSISNSSNSTSQSATFDSYPSAPCTVRMGGWVDRADVSNLTLIIGIPSDVDDVQNESYWFNCASDSGMGASYWDGFAQTSMNSNSTTITENTPVDFAVEFEDTGSACEFTFTIWEYVSGSWSKLDTLNATDSGRRFPNADGVGFGGQPAFDSADGFYVDEVRFYDSLGENGTPNWTP